MNLEEELINLINTYSLENGSNTPDSVLSSYILNCIHTFNKATNMRDKYLGIEHFKNGTKIEQIKERVE